MKTFRTSQEDDVARRMAEIFERSADPTAVRLQNFPKYVRRQHLKRFLALYEIFKKVLPVKGSIVECGVFRGFGVMSWAKLSAMLEPENLTRRIYGFDTFAGFPDVGSQDATPIVDVPVGGLSANSFDELHELIAEFDRDRFLGHIDKVHLIRGDIAETVPSFVETHPHMVVSLLFLDVDLFEPTRVALEHFLPRMPKGAVVAFDELDNPQWPGETLAALHGGRLQNLRLQRFEWDPYIAFAVLD